MSLAVTLSNALSGLAANQSALQVTSNNVANANTEGYARKTVELESRLLDGIGSGVSISGVNRAVDEFLLREVRRESATLAERDVRREFYSRLQNLFGTLGDNSSIGASITRFSTAIETVATSPEVAAHRQEAVNAGAAAARELNELADRVQELRGETNREIAAAVEDINQQLQTIEELNGKITELKQTGRTTGELEDQRALAVDALSEYLPIQYFERSNGQMVVLTRTGQPLVESRASQLGYEPAALVTSAQSYVAPGDPGYPGPDPRHHPEPRAAPPDPIADSARDLTGLLNTGKLSRADRDARHHPAGHRGPIRRTGLPPPRSGECHPQHRHRLSRADPDHRQPGSAGRRGDADLRHRFRAHRHGGRQWRHERAAARSRPEHGGDRQRHRDPRSTAPPG